MLVPVLVAVCVFLALWQLSSAIEIRKLRRRAHGVANAFQVLLMMPGVDLSPEDLADVARMVRGEPPAAPPLPTIQRRGKRR